MFDEMLLYLPTLCFDGCVSLPDHWLPARYIRKSAVIFIDEYDDKEVMEDENGEAVAGDRWALIIRLILHLVMIMIWVWRCEHYSLPDYYNSYPLTSNVALLIYDWDQSHWCASRVLVRHKIIILIMLKVSVIV
jgi:hypothetical protein